MCIHSEKIHLTLSILTEFRGWSQESSFYSPISHIPNYTDNTQNMRTCYYGHIHESLSLISRRRRHDTRYYNINYYYTILYYIFFLITHYTREIQVNSAIYVQYYITHNMYIQQNPNIRERSGPENLFLVNGFPKIRQQGKLPCTFFKGFFYITLWFFHVGRIQSGEFTLIIQNYA